MRTARHACMNAEWPLTVRTRCHMYVLGVATRALKSALYIFTQAHTMNVMNPQGLALANSMLHVLLNSMNTMIDLVLIVLM